MKASRNFPARTSLKANIAVMLFSLCSVLAAAEVFLHFFNPAEVKIPEKPKEHWALVPERVWTEHHPVLGWYHQKNKTALMTLNRGLEVPLRTNSIGLRSHREFTPEKREGVRRIGVLGDSFSFGWGVREEETFSAQLEKLGKNLEVLNFGVAGYGIDQILLSFRTLAKPFYSDYVLISIFPEDFWRATRAFADTGHAKPYFTLSAAGELQLRNVPVPPPFTLRSNQFPPLLEYHPVEKILQQSYFYRLLKRGWVALGKNLKILDADSTEEWILGRSILRQLVKEIRESGAVPVIVIVPPNRWIGSGHRKESLHKSLFQFAKREQVPLLDLTPELQQAVRQASLADFYIEEDWHWTAKGHELAAKAILRFLSDKNL